MFSKPSTTLFRERKKLINVKESPLVSVIMPVYNSDRFVLEAIESVIEQTYSNWELIIVDDASTDYTSEIIEKVSQRHPNITAITLENNKGPGFCRNKATEIAHGDYIAFLDSDDRWTIDKLQIQLDFMVENACAVSFTSYLHIDEMGNALHKRINAMPLLSYEKQFRNNYIGNLTGIYHAASIGKIKSPDIPKRQDWALWLEAIKRSKKPARGIAKDLAFYRIRKNSVSANKIGLLKHNFNFYYSHLGYSKAQSLYFTGSFLWEYFLIRPRFIENTN